MQEPERSLLIVWRGKFEPNNFGPFMNSNFPSIPLQQVPSTVLETRQEMASFKIPSFRRRLLCDLRSKNMAPEPRMS